MKLKSFKVRNFRSIDSAELKTHDLTLLIGPNNEGKSNLLRGLVIALGAMSGGLGYRITAGRLTRAAEYEWARDYPIALQRGAGGKQGSGHSEFTLEFALNDADRRRFLAEVGSHLSGDLRVQIGLGAGGSQTFKVVIQGPAQKILSARKQQIGKFLSGSIEIVYIPTHRTASQSEEVVEALVSRALRTLSDDPEYQATLAKLRDFERPLLDEMGRKITETLKTFISDVKSVELVSQRRASRNVPDSVELLVDDGTKTTLTAKGDGIQSLAAIALIRDSRQARSEVSALVFAIEEPESHLHPKAVRNLRNILIEVAQSHQVIATTHSALLVSRDPIESSIVVIGSHAEPARRLSDIRDALGIHLSDNLTTADLVLMLEGEEDEQFLRAWLTAKYPELRKAFAEGLIAIDTLAGGSKLASKARLHKANLCNVHAFIDSDQAGNAAVQVATSTGALEPNEVQQVICHGRTESELEDLFDLAVYGDAMKSRFGVDLPASQRFAKGKKKWSDRMEASFRASGVVWDKATKAAAKAVVQDSVSAKVGSSVRPPSDDVLKALATRLIERLPR